jgi:hypothetical protein
MKHPISKSKKWGSGILITLILLIVATYLFFRSQIDNMLGGNTEVVDVSQFQVISGPLAITNVNVLTSDSQTMQANQTVLIKDNKIQAVGKTITVPNNYHLINGEGKYLIPGLVDSHVHIKKSKNDLLLYIANGVTQIGEMTGMEHHFDYIEEIKNGAIGPHIFIASPKITSQDNLKAMFRSKFEKRHQNFLTPQKGRKAVRNFVSMGYDAIKLSSDLDKDIYYAINDEAKKLNIPVIGHLPVGLQLDDLYQSGQSQLAHIDSISHNLMNEFGGLTSKNSEAFLDHIRQVAESIAIKFKQENIALASTVWLHQTRPKQDFNLTGFLKTIEFEFQNPGWVEGSFISNGCLPGGNSYENPHNTGVDDQRSWDIYYRAYNEAIKIITQALVRHNVTITAGTDALGACGMIAGFSLHNELKALNTIGLSNAQVLHAATLAPANWMGTNAGKIAAGFRADLVLLDKNPLDDISNTKTIKAVIANGNYLDRTQLDNILEAVKEANNKSRKIGIDAFLN